MYPSASGVVTSLRATIRSTSRPDQPELLLVDALDGGSRRLGPDDHQPLGRGRRLRVPRARAPPSDRPARGRPGGDGGDHGPVPAHRLELLELHGVGLGADDEPRTVEQVGAVLGELVEQDPFLLGGRRLGRGEVDQHAQHAGTLDVAQELVAEPAPLAGTFDQPGDVGDHEVGLVVERHDPEVGLERRERVVGDLRLGGRDHADQRALAGVGEADQRDVGHQLQLELEPALLAVLALLGEARRPPPVAEELGVAAPAAPAGGGQEAVAVVVGARPAPRPSRDPSRPCPPAP